MKKSVILSGLALALTMSAQAATQTSSSSVQQVAPSLIDKITASYAVSFLGPAIMAAPDSNYNASYQPDAYLGNATTAGGRVTTKNYLSADYKLSESTKVGAVAYWRMKPIGGFDYEVRDPYLKLSNSKFFTSGNLNVAADLRLAAPVYKVSQDQGMITYLMSKQISSYSIPSSRFTVGLTTYQIARAFGAAKAGIENADRFDVEVYAGPSLDYQLLPNLTAGLLYELGAHHSVGAGLDFVNDGTDLEPNLSWDITPAINFNPWLDIKTGGKIAGYTTSVGAAFSWKLL